MCLNSRSHTDKEAGGAFKGHWMVVGWMAEAEGDTRLQSVCVRALVWMPAVKHINNSGQARVMPPPGPFGTGGGGGYHVSCPF